MGLKCTLPAIVAASMLAWPAAASAGQEPFWDSKPLSYWVTALSSPGPAWTRPRGILCGRVGHRPGRQRGCVRGSRAPAEPCRSLAEVRESAAHALEQIGAPAARPAVATLLGLMSTDTAPQVRRRAALALGRIDPTAEDVITGAARTLRDDQDMSVRVSAAVLLMASGRSAGRVSNALSAALTDDSHAVRLYSAAALVKTPEGHSAFPRLLDVLQDDDAALRAEAVGLLVDAGRGREEVMPALVRALGDQRCRGARRGGGRARLTRQAGTYRAAGLVAAAARSRRNGARPRGARRPRDQARIAACGGCAARARSSASTNCRASTVILSKAPARDRALQHQLAPHPYRHGARLDEPGNRVQIDAACGEEVDLRETGPSAPSGNRRHLHGSPGRPSRCRPRDSTPRTPRSASWPPAARPPRARCALAITSGTRHGHTRNSAPASSAPTAIVRSVTVPAPSRMSWPNRDATERIASSASGTVIVISMVRMPPSTRASVTRTATSAESARMTGTSPPAFKVLRTSALARRVMTRPPGLVCSTAAFTRSAEGTPPARRCV